MNVYMYLFSGDEAAADAAARAYWAMEAAAPASSSASSKAKASTVTAQAPAVLPFGVKVITQSMYSTHAAVI
jgi:hypothetical protein